MTIGAYLPTNIPPIDSETGTLNRNWLFFFISLLNRTGGTTGNNSDSFNYPADQGTAQQVLSSQGPGVASIWRSLSIPTKLSDLSNDEGFITGSALTSLAPISSPVFQGAPSGPTAPVNTNSSQLATTAFVLNQSSATLPGADNSTGGIGASFRYARADHTHPFTTAADFSVSCRSLAFFTNAGPSWTGGTGAPTFAPTNGSLYSRTDGGTNTTLYLYRSGAWVGIA